MVEKEVERTIEALLEERREFEPPKEFAAEANAGDASIYEHASKDPDAWWESQAERLTWSKKWDKVLEWDPPHHQWFIGGKLNASVNCLDRHLEDNGDRVAFHWVGEPGDSRSITYRDLHTEVCKLANALKELGVAKGDRVAIYLPMVPELPASMLACTRIGAVHSVVFGGFSAGSLRDRINDADCKVLITADGGYRRGQTVPLKENADEALEETKSIEKVIVVRRTTDDVSMTEGRDIVYSELIESQPDQCEP
jgi:acetyl-CoA synthetase